MSQKLKIHKTNFVSIIIIHIQALIAITISHNTNSHFYHNLLQAARQRRTFGERQLRPILSLLTEYLSKTPTVLDWQGVNVCSISMYTQANVLVALSKLISVLLQMILHGAHQAKSLWLCMASCLPRPLFSTSSASLSLTLGPALATLLSGPRTAASSC